MGESVCEIIPDGRIFLYPEISEFPFDGICREITLELEKRNFLVPGIDVEFARYGTGENKFRQVRSVRGKNFKLKFFRDQREATGRFEDYAAVERIAIMGGELELEFGNAASFYYYVGKDWVKDRDQFLDGKKYFAKLHGAPRIYLKYCGSRASFKDNINGEMMLPAVDDSRREYAPEDGDPKAIDLVAVSKRIAVYLEKSVLPYIRSFAVPPKIDLFPGQPRVDFPSCIGPLFTMSTLISWERVNLGRKDPSLLAPHERYGLIGYVWLPGGSDALLPGAGGEFLWAAVGEVPLDVTIASLKLSGCPCEVIGLCDDYLFGIKPENGNDIFIIDEADAERFWQNHQYDVGAQRTYHDMVAKTIMRVSDYRGGFERPIVLIGRELALNEVVPLRKMEPGANV